jgi:hypothetical protein
VNVDGSGGPIAAAFREGEMLDVEIVAATPHSLIGTPARVGLTAGCGEDPSNSAQIEDSVASHSAENRSTSVKEREAFAEERSRSTEFADPARGALRVL